MAARRIGAVRMAYGLMYGLLLSHLLQPRPSCTAKAPAIHLSAWPASKITTPAKGDAKIFQAGKVAIAKADSIAKLTEVTDRMETRKGDLSDEQYAELLKLALEREDSLAEVDPFDD